MAGQDAGPSVADGDTGAFDAGDADAETSQPEAGTPSGPDATDGGVHEDPFGQRWSIMTHKEDLTPDEMQARMAKLGGA